MEEPLEKAQIDACEDMMKELSAIKAECIACEKNHDAKYEAALCSIRALKMENYQLKAKYDRLERQLADSAWSAARM